MQNPQTRETRDPEHHEGNSHTAPREVIKRRGAQRWWNPYRWRFERREYRFKKCTLFTFRKAAGIVRLLLCDCGARNHRNLPFISGANHHRVVRACGWTLMVDGALEPKVYKCTESSLLPCGMLYYIPRAKVKWALFRLRKASEFRRHAQIIVRGVVCECSIQTTLHKHSIGSHTVLFGRGPKYMTHTVHWRTCKS